MKKFTITTAALVLAVSASFSHAGVFENKNAPAVNPYAQQNAQIQTQSVATTEIKTQHLNPKENNPLFKVDNHYQVGTGTAYSVQTQR